MQRHILGPNRFVSSWHHCKLRLSLIWYSYILFIFNINNPVLIITTSCTRSAAECRPMWSPLYFNWSHSYYILIEVVVIQISLDQSTRRPLHAKKKSLCYVYTYILLCHIFVNSSGTNQYNAIISIHCDKFWTSIIFGRMYIMRALDCVCSYLWRMKMTQINLSCI